MMNEAPLIWSAPALVPLSSVDQSFGGTAPYDAEDDCFNTFPDS
jgi:hypothetical protein